jgi:hypothetical protein
MLHANNWKCSALTNRWRRAALLICAITAVYASITASWSQDAPRKITHELTLSTLCECPHKHVTNAWQTKLKPSYIFTTCVLETFLICRSTQSNIAVTIKFISSIQIACDSCYTWGLQSCESQHILKMHKTIAILMLNWRQDSLILSLSSASYSGEGLTQVIGFKIWPQIGHSCFSWHWNKTVDIRKHG